MKERGPAYFSIVLLLLFLSAVAFIGIQRPPWGDERHFAETVRLFGEAFSLETLRSYEEMSMPLPFLLYAGWGRVFSFELPVLRLFSLLVAFLTFVVFYRTAASGDLHPYLPLALTGWLAINPYMVGLSLFVFPDMLTILFAVLAIEAVLNGRPIALAVWNALGLLCRQYFLFLTLALGCLHLARYLKTRKNAPLRAVALLGASVLPSMALFVFWGSVSPDNTLKALYLGEGVQYHPDFAVLYLVLLFLYPLPFILYRWRDFYTDRTVLAGSFLLSWIYWLFPVRAADPALAGGVDTVGFTHRVLIELFNRQVVDAIFYVLFFLSLPVLYTMIREVWSRWKHGALDAEMLWPLSFIAFLAVMPFSYLCWEKYFLPVLPMVLLYVVGRGS